MVFGTSRLLKTRNCVGWCRCAIFCCAKKQSAWREWRYRQELARFSVGLDHGLAKKGHGFECEPWPFLLTLILSYYVLASMRMAAAAGPAAATRGRCRATGGGTPSAAIRTGAARVSATPAVRTCTGSAVPAVRACRAVRAISVGLCIRSTG